MDEITHYILVPKGQSETKSLYQFVDDRQGKLLFGNARQAQDVADDYNKHPEKIAQPKGFGARVTGFDVAKITISLKLIPNAPE